MTLSMTEAILKYLQSAGVEYVFGIPAGMISPFYDSLIDYSDIKPIITKNEAGAAYMAARYAGTTGKLAVCAGAGAVGVNNMINGIADAARIKAPLLVITGYVNRWQMGKGAIQELDSQDIVKPITKYSRTILNEADVLSELDKAVRIALTPPCGPVYVSIPIDVQRQEAPGPVPAPPDVGDLQTVKPGVAQLERAAAILNESPQGIIMVGRGGRGFSADIRRLSERLQWPVITTPAGKGVVSADFALNLGNYGFASTDAAYEYVTSSGASAILILGTSLGESSTLNFNDVLVAGRKVIHVDRDARELGKIFTPDVGIHGDLQDVLPYLIDHTKPSPHVFRKPLRINDPYELNHTGISLRLFLENLKTVMPPSTRYACDIGEFANFVLKYLEIGEDGDFDMNLNYGAMGSAVAGGAGLWAADKTKPVAVFAGDGCFFMNGMEILTSKEYRIPVIYFIINNSMLSYVDRGHKFLHDRALPDFRQERISIADMVRTAGIKALSIDRLEDMERIPAFVRELTGPCLIEVNTDGSEPAPILDRIKSLKK